MLYAVTQETDGVRHVIGRMLKNKEKAVAKANTLDTGMVTDHTNRVVHVSRILLAKHDLDGMFVQHGG